MQCPQCQHDNEPPARYCGGCGQALRRHCAACGSDNSPTNDFCNRCGAELSGAVLPHKPPTVARPYTPAHLADKILGSTSALEGERKQVTVLFCDIANSTELARRLGADAMHELLNSFFEVALAEVHRVEGTINQFLGDGFMALFGAPVAHEDHVRRALLSALAILQKLKEAEIDDSGGLGQVRVRMGINTGMVVVGTIGDNLRTDYTAVGDTTNIAARLQQLAQPGRACVSESVYITGSAFFDFHSIGKRMLKGIAEPMSVFELTKTRPRETMGSRATRLGITSPLVGRQREIALLQASLDQLANGQGGILILAGEPGVGKSRLVAETRRLSKGGRTLWLEGRAVSFGRSLSYLPFIDILKESFDIADDDADEDSWSKLEIGLEELFAERAHDFLPYLATMLALRIPDAFADRIMYLDGPAFRRQVFLCMRQLFERLATRQPLVLFLEDWHWADQSSIELAEHLLPLAGTKPLLVFLATRPDPEGPTARIQQIAASQGGQRLQEVALAPLSDADSAVLVGNLVGQLDIPAGLRGQILRKTEGNPFFIEEVIRSLVTEGVLVRGARDSSWQLARQHEQVHLPDTVQGLILARIDRLEEEVKQALKLASVIGRSFFNRILEVISKAQRNLGGNLAELEHAELIRQTQLVPEVEYIFKHALVHEAAYGSILAENRRAIHRRVAQAIEMLFEDRPEEFTSLLAHHYTRAEDWGKAQEYLFKAGDQAGRMAADTEALEHFRQAEAAYVKAFGDKLSPLQQAALARKIGAALYGTGHYEQSLEQLRRALSRLGLHYPTSRWGVRRAILRYLGAHLMRGIRARLGMPAARKLDLAWAQEISTICHFMSWMDYFLDKERMLLDCLLELHAGELSSYRVAEARGLSSLGFGFMTFQALGLSRRYHNAARAVAERTDNASAIAFAWFALGFLDYYDGLWDACDRNLNKGGSLYLESGDIHRWGGAMLMRSLVLYFRGDLTQTAALASELLRAGQDSADPQLTSWGYQVQGYPAMACGPLATTINHLRTGVALAARIPAWDNYLYQKALLSKCLVLQGKIDEGRAELGDALDIIQVHHLTRPFDKIEVLTALANCAIAIADRALVKGDANETSQALREARTCCESALRDARRMRGWLPEALRMRGTADWLSGNKTGALNYWRQSVAEAEQSRFPIEGARAFLEMGMRSQDPALIEQACAVFRAKGARVFLAIALHCQARLLAQSSAGAQSAIDGFSRAIEALELVDADFDLQQARIVHARLVGA